jgi:hypothetical protein
MRLQKHLFERPYCVNKLSVMVCAVQTANNCMHRWVGMAWNFLTVRHTQKTRDSQPGLNYAGVPRTATAAHVPSPCNSSCL